MYKLQRQRQSSVPQIPGCWTGGTAARIRWSRVIVDKVHNGRCHLFDGGLNFGRNATAAGRCCCCGRIAVADMLLLGLLLLLLLLDLLELLTGEQR